MAGWEGFGRGTVTECWCGRRSQGRVGDRDGVPAHQCGECSPEHCHRAYDLRRCEFGVCGREAELELVLSDSLAPVKVCGLHVSPVLGWGVPEPIQPRIRYLMSQNPGAAA